MSYFVYIVVCRDDTLYTGVTTDIERRIQEHNGFGSRGAKYTATRAPVVLKYSAEYSSRSLAQIEESRIKRLTRIEKIKLIQSNR